jgi:hypothetical protein
VRSSGALAIATVLALGIAGPAPAQTPRPPAATEPGANLDVAVVTFGPGDAVWEHFGHNAIWIRDTTIPGDEGVSYNYGLFDFNQPYFIPRFLQGRMWYAMGGFPGRSYNQIYVRENRSIWIQELALPPRARAELLAFLEWNAREENRHYFYDYYRDNCSTRVRDAIDRVIGGRIRAATAAVPSGTTYRFHTRRLTEDDPLIYTGLELVLGRPADRPISGYEDTFLPLKLRDWLRTVTVERADGTVGPLVREERTVYGSTRAPMPEAPPRWIPRYLLIGLAIGGGLLLLAARAANGGVTARRSFAWLGGAWLALVGVAGTIVTALWAITDHAATYANENVLQANLLALPLAILLPRALYGADGARRAARMLALVVAALSLVGLLFKLEPGGGQVNGEVLALLVPAQLGVTAGLLLAARGPLAAVPGEPSER